MVRCVSVVRRYSGGTRIGSATVLTTFRPQRILVQRCLLWHGGAAYLLAAWPAAWLAGSKWRNVRVCILVYDVGLTSMASVFGVLSVTLFGIIQLSDQSMMVLTVFGIASPTDAIGTVYAAPCCDLFNVVISSRYTDL